MKATVDPEDTFEKELQMYENPAGKQTNPNLAKEVKAKEPEDKMSVFNKSFLIPTLPEGQILEFNIL